MTVVLDWKISRQTVPDPPAYCTMCGESVSPALCALVVCVRSHPDLPRVLPLVSSWPYGRHDTGNRDRRGPEPAA